MNLFICGILGTALGTLRMLTDANVSATEYIFKAKRVFFRITLPKLEKFHRKLG